MAHPPATALIAIACLAFVGGCGGGGSGGGGDGEVAAACIDAWNAPGNEAARADVTVAPAVVLVVQGACSAIALGQAGALATAHTAAIAGEPWVRDAVAVGLLPDAERTPNATFQPDGTLKPGGSGAAAAGAGAKPLDETTLRDRAAAACSAANTHLAAIRDGAATAGAERAQALSAAAGADAEALAKLVPPAAMRADYAYLVGATAAEMELRARVAQHADAGGSALDDALRQARDVVRLRASRASSVGVTECSASIFTTPDGDVAPADILPVATTAAAPAEVEPAPEPAPVATAETPAQTAPATGQAETAATVPPQPTTPATATTASAEVPTTRRWLRSPSGNIECQVSWAEDGTGRAICQAFKQPRSVVLGPDGAYVVCDGVGCLGNGPEDAVVLAYGKTLGVGGFRCTSAAAGMTCVATANGRGFRLARDGVRAVG